MAAVPGKSGVDYDEFVALKDFMMRDFFHEREVKTFLLSLPLNSFYRTLCHYSST